MFSTQPGGHPACVAHGRHHVGCCPRWLGYLVCCSCSPCRHLGCCWRWRHASGGTGHHLQNRHQQEARITMAACAMCEMLTVGGSSTAAASHSTQLDQHCVAAAPRRTRSFTYTPAPPHTRTYNHKNTHYRHLPGEPSCSGTCRCCLLGLWPSLPPLYPPLSFLLLLPALPPPPPAPSFLGLLLPPPA